MDRISTLLSCLFGYMFLALSLFVTTETIMRKILNISFQGADELGGYALAVGSTLAFTITLIGKGHIRIDLLHDHLPKKLQAALNWISSVLLAMFAILLLRVCYTVVVDTIDYGSVAPTPWATPLIIPQAAWFGALIVFAITAVFYAARATYYFVSLRFDQLNKEFHPKGAMEELSEEMEDLEHRAETTGAR
jgi:TRAP-type C4-dicarboxylate transport system permease small subunit